MEISFQRASAPSVSRLPVHAAAGLIPVSFISFPQAFLVQSAIASQGEITASLPAGS
jgi:hypothetical protein